MTHLCVACCLTRRPTSDPCEGHPEHLLSLWLLVSQWCDGQRQPTFLRLERHRAPRCLELGPLWQGGTLQGPHPPGYLHLTEGAFSANDAANRMSVYIYFRFPFFMIYKPCVVI